MFIIKELVENDSLHPHLTRDLDWFILPVLNPDGYSYTMSYGMYISNFRRFLSTKVFSEINGFIWLTGPTTFAYQFHFFIVDNISTYFNHFCCLEVFLRRKFCCLRNRYQSCSFTTSKVFRQFIFNYLIVPQIFNIAQEIS